MFDIDTIFISLHFSILSDNSLLHIDSDAFIGLNNLKRLSLHNCGLSVVPGKALSHLKSLNAL